MLLCINSCVYCIRQIVRANVYRIARLNWVVVIIQIYILYIYREKFSLNCKIAFRKQKRKQQEKKHRRDRETDERLFLSERCLEFCGIRNILVYCMLFVLID